VAGEWSGSERRQRVRVEIEIDAGFEASNSADVIPCRTVDISEDGARVRSLAPLPVGARGLIVLDAPDTSLVMAGCEVERQSAEDLASGTYRLAFTDMTQANRIRFRLLLEDPLAITSDPDVARIMHVISAA
jgi:c-di-GMP-binding flagellar brake protein YcgR